MITLPDTKETVELTFEVPKLSHLIREGAKLRPQCQYMWFWEGGSCALGAAWEASGGGDLSDLDSAQEMGAALGNRAIVPPLDIMERITLFNDYKGWTREQIADWLEEQGY